MRIIDATTVRFVAVGAINTLVGLSCIYLSLYAFGLGNISANAVGYTVGIVVSFVLNKKWTFSHAGRSIPAFTRFLGVIAVAYATNLGTVLVAAEGLGWNHYIAQALGIIPYTVVGYIGSRFFAFRAPDGVARTPQRDRS